MKKLLSIALSCCILLQTLVVLTFAGSVSDFQENMIYNPQLNFTHNGSTYSVDGWSLPSIATVTEGADGYNVVTIATSTTDKTYALRSTKQLNLDADKYYKFSIMYKLTDPPSGNFNINNKVFLTYKYNNNYINKVQLTKNSEWTEASFIMYGGDVTASAWDKFFTVVSNYSRCTLSVKMPNVTVYNPDVLDVVNSESKNILENGDFNNYDAQTNEIKNLVIEGKTMPWYGGHSVEKAEIDGVSMNAVRISTKLEGNDRRVRMNFDNTLISKDAKYKFTAWIKIEDNSVTDSFNNNSGNGAIKLCFHHGNTNNFGSVKYQTKSDWQRIELIVDSNLHKGEQWWSDPSSNNYFGVGINVYNMNCDILLADLKLEEMPPISVSTQEAQNGTIEINRTTAQIGDNIQVLAKADSDYKLNRLYYTDGNSETDITAKKQTVGVSATVSGHNATTYTSVASDLIYSFSLSVAGDYTVMAEFVSENEEPPTGGGEGGGNEPTPDPVGPSETPNEGTYLDNYDFEAYKDSKVVGWTEGNFGDVATQSYSTVSHGGDYALQIDNTNRNGVPMITQVIKTFDSTKLYRIGVFVKTISEMDRSYDGGGIKVRVSYTSGGQNLNISSSGYKNLEEWTEIYTLFQLPQDATNVKAVVILDCIAGSVLIDDMSITEVGDALENEEGKFTNSGFETFVENEFIGWKFYNGGNGNNSATQGDGRTGKAAVLKDTNTDHIMHLSQGITLDRTKKHLISIYVKSTYDDSTSFYVPSWGGAYLEYTAGDYTVTSELITTSTPYKKVSIVVDGSKIPENTNGTVKFVMKYMRGIIYLDDASIVEYTEDVLPEENVENLYNTSFEEGSGDVFEYWTKNTGANISLVSSDTAYDKDRAVKAVSTNRNAVASISQEINKLDSSKRYLLSVWAKQLTELDYSYTGAGVKLSVTYTLDGSSVSAGSVTLREMTDWTQLKLYFQVPENAQKVTAKITFDCFEGEVLIDYVTLTEIGGAVIKQDGQFANGGFEEYYDGQFAEWQFYNGGNSENSITQDVGRTGKAAVLKDTNTDHIMSLSQSVVLDRTKKYLISIYVKATYDDSTSFYVPSWGGAYLEYTAGEYTVTSETITTTAPYKKVSIVVDGSKIPENTNGTVKFVMKYMRGIIYLDDATITEYSGEEEIPETDDEEEELEPLYNTSFEDGEGDTFEYWTKNTGANISLVSSDTAYDKDRAVKAVSTNRNAVASISQEINKLDSSKRYLLSVWAKQLTELDYSYTGAGVKLSVTYTLDGSSVSAGSVTLREMTDWIQLKLYFQVPENAQKVTAKITFDCFKGEILVDYVTLTEIGKAVEKKDGQFANGGFEEYYDGQFAEWQFYNGGNSENSITQDVGRTGKAAVLKDTNTDHILNFSQSGIVLDRTKKYLISMYVKATYDDSTSFYVPSWGGAYLEYTAGEYTVTSETITTTAPYKKVSIVVDGSKIPENTNGTVKFVMKYMRGIIYLDDATITEYSGEEEIPETDDEEEELEPLYNTSFEEGSGDVFEYWTKSTGKNISIVSSNMAYDKNRAVKAVSIERNAVGSISQGINNLDSSKRYLLSVWAKQLTEMDYSYTGAGVKLSVTYTLDGSSVSAGSVTLREMTDWTQLKLYFQVPENAQKVTAKITFDCFKGEVLVDYVTLTEIGKAVEKQDGQFANGGFEEYYDGQFAEWSFYNGGNSKNSITQDVGRTGKAAVLRDTNTDHIMSLSQNVVLDRSKTYKISLFLRATSDDDTSFYVPSWGGAYLQLKAGDFSVVSEEITSTCRYRQLSIIVDASKIPEGTTPNVSFVMKYMRGIIYLDDALIEVYDGTQKDEPIVYEDLYNLSFEEGKNNSFEDWNKSVGKNVEILATTSIHHEGARAVKIVSTDRNAVAKLYQNINNVDVTKRYRITVWAKTEDEVDVAYDGGGIKLQVTYVDSDGKTQNSSSAPRKTIDEWTQLYVDYQIPEGATNVRVNLVSDCLKGVVYYDDMTIKVIGNAVVMPKADPLNLAPNFSFENGQDGSFPGWYWWTNNSKNTCEIGEPHLGAQSAKVTSRVADSSAQLSLDTSSFDNTGWYQFSAWVKTEDVTPLSAGNGGVAIAIQFKKTGGNTNLKTYRSERLTGSNGWTKLVAVGKFPEDCKRVVFALSLSQATGTVYWDDVDIRKVEYSDTNMIKNGTFDEADEDGNLLYWEKETDDWSFASFGFENNVATVNNAGVCSSYYYQDIEELFYGEEYVISGKVSADSIVTQNGGAAVVLQMIDVYGNIVERKLCNEYVSGTSETDTEFCVKFKLSENCKKARIALMCDKSAGTAGFSDLRLVSLNDFSGTEVLEPTTLKYVSNFAENNLTPIVDSEGFDFIPIIIAVSVILALGTVSVILITVIKRRKVKKV